MGMDKTIPPKGSFVKALILLIVFAISAAGAATSIVWAAAQILLKH